jgi:hypothetical protein
MKISNDIGNQTRNLPAYSTVSQPTVPLSAPKSVCSLTKYYEDDQIRDDGMDGTQSVQGWMECKVCKEEVRNV